MSSENAQVLRDAYEAFGRGDIPAVIEVFDENMTFHVPDVLPQGMHVEGRDGLEGFFQNLAATWDEFGLELDQVDATGDRGYATGRASGTLKGSPASYEFVHVWTLRDGLCTRFAEYADPSPELIAAAATAAPARS